MLLTARLNVCFCTLTACLHGAPSLSVYVLGPLREPSWATREPGSRRHPPKFNVTVRNAGATSIAGVNVALSYAVHVALSSTYCTQTIVNVH